MSEETVQSASGPLNDIPPVVLTKTPDGVIHALLNGRVIPGMTAEVRMIAEPGQPVVGHILRLECPMQGVGYIDFEKLMAIRGVEPAGEAPEVAEEGPAEDPVAAIERETAERIAQIHREAQERITALSQIPEDATEVPAEVIND